MFAISKRLVVFSFVFVACGPSAPAAEPGPAAASPSPIIADAPTSGTTHGVAGAASGSHEDWCSEHAVPESLCTRCNPKLIPAFKATGDWCAEHALPESQCLLCHPDLKIVRPPKIPQ